MSVASPWRPNSTSPVPGGLHTFQHRRCVPGGTRLNERDFKTLRFMGSVGLLLALPLLTLLASVALKFCCAINNRRPRRKRSVTNHLTSRRANVRRQSLAANCTSPVPGGSKQCPSPVPGGQIVHRQSLAACTPSNIAVASLAAHGRMKETSRHSASLVPLDFSSPFLCSLCLLLLL